MRSFFISTLDLLAYVCTSPFSAPTQYHKCLLRAVSGIKGVTSVVIVVHVIDIGNVLHTVRFLFNLY